MTHAEVFLERREALGSADVIAPHLKNVLQRDAFSVLVGELFEASPNQTGLLLDAIHPLPEVDPQ